MVQNFVLGKVLVICELRVTVHVRRPNCPPLGMDLAGLHDELETPGLRRCRLASKPPQPMRGKALRSVFVVLQS